MSSPDRIRSARGRLGLVALAAALALGGCSDVRPLYGTTATGETTAARIATIDLKLADSRIGQRVRNELVFAFYGGGEPAEPRYRLNLRVNDSSIPVGIERTESTPAAYLVQLNATFTLTDVASGATILSGTSFANASYDFSQQRFANVRAQRDAENRAANQIAADIRTKVVAWLATHS
jgi:LPS-assembly lipoprotein